MIIGVPKEIKNNENRVALTPAGASELIRHGHEVYVQVDAGKNSGFPDEAYTEVGARLLPTIEDVYAKAEMIIKVKEPIAPEYPLIRPGQLVFTYFHFAASEELTRAMIEPAWLMKPLNRLTEAFRCCCLCQKWQAVCLYRKVCSSWKNLMAEKAYWPEVFRV